MQKLERYGKIKNNNLEYKLVSEEDVVDTFNCGNQSINTYLKNLALIDFYERTGSTCLAYGKDGLVGFFTLWRSALPQIKREVIIVQYLAVSSIKQDTGIGSELTEYLVNVALTANERYIFLQALKDDKLELIEWYKNRGFIVADEDELTDKTKDLVWMFMDLLDEESLNKMFNEP